MHYIKAPVTKAGTKPCRICGEVKGLSEFYRFREMKDGYRSECKKCNNTYATVAAEKMVLLTARESSAQIYMETLRMWEESHAING